MKNKEKYTFGYSDPRAMYGSAKAEDAAPDVEWELFEPHNDYEIAAALPWIGAAALVLLVLL